MDAPARKRSFGETVNTWVQTIGILIAAIWGFYTFVYKEVELPKSAPVNISLNLQLKKVESGSLAGDLTAVEMKVSATNPSSRKIYLLPTAWIAYGANINAARNDEATFSHAASDVLKDRNIIATQQRFADLKGLSVVATGHLFHYNSLKPGETIGRTLVLFVPKKECNFVSVSTFMPSAEDVSGIELEWTLEQASPNFQLISHIYPLRKTGQREAELGDREFRDSVKRLDLQTAESHAEISLWP